MKYNIVVERNYQKFASYTGLKQRLLETYIKELVEASLFDRTRPIEILREGVIYRLKHRAVYEIVGLGVTGISFRVMVDKRSKVEEELEKD
ncbi:hypothetical protein G7Y89_g3335 [Cudoniella acicularis]|uniref:Uncharacterized protein n=1 Tax=Cudoniella acicularis TaxID=354080 RepID=A0A8H4W5P3_9HELO|nr:hypothetical protein G7Y89_g3335 [Cudoniella acicularis]